VHLDAGFERLAEAVAADGLLDEKSTSELWTSIERASDAARTVAALVAAYRRIVADLAQALGSPTRARRDRSMRRALAFVREHLSEPLPLARVARAAGFAPKYFCQLFRQSEGVAYATYLRDLRVARAKEMLRLTRLTVERVGRSCGFRTRTHFHRAFRRSVGMTPMAYRAS
jgi:two-component system response regulator YesN